MPVQFNIDFIDCIDIWVGQWFDIEIDAIWYDLETTYQSYRYRYNLCREKKVPAKKITKNELLIFLVVTL